MKKKLALALALLMILTSAAACSEKEEDKQANTTEVSSEEIEIEEEVESECPYWDAVRKEDLGGISIDAATAAYTSNYYNVLDWDEITGDRLNDAVFDRNRYIEEMLNCTLKCTQGDALNRMRNAIKSGSGEIDICYELVGNGGSLISGGYLMPFNSIETIDMTQPYWDQGAQKCLKILGQLYYGFLDFGFDHYDSMAVIFYAGQMVEDYQLEDPYQLFLEGNWTTDKMLEQMKAVSKDLNGDGKMKLGDDQYGFAGREYSYQPILYASGTSLVSWDDEQSTFVLNMKNEDFYDIAMATSSIFQTSNSDFVDYSNYDLGRTAFSAGKVLFYSRLLGDFKNLREVEDDYGLICFPKYSEAKGESSYFVQNPTTLFLPSDIGDDNHDHDDDYYEVGIFLQAIGAYTFDYTLDEYIESAVIGKGMRDQNSADMVRIMIQNRSFDLCQSFDFNISSAFCGAIKTSSKFASTASKAENMFKKSADKVVASIEKYAAD